MQRHRGSMPGLVKCVRDILVLTDNTGEILLVNRAAVHAYGYSKDELLSMNIFDLLDEESCYTRAEESFPLGEFGEFLARRKDGTSFWAEVKTRRARLSGRNTFITIIRDISKRIQLEQSLHELELQNENLLKEQRILALRHQKIAHLNSMSAMSAGLVHEIAQPLNAMKVIADSALLWLKMGRTMDLQEHMENYQAISEQILHIEKMMQHIQSFCQFDSCSEQLPTRVNLNQSIQGALTVISRQLMNHQIQIHTDLAEDLPPVLAEDHVLEELIINLLVNAMQALDEVRKSDKWVSLKTCVEDGDVIVDIMDNATGIPEEIKDQIFEPFVSTRKNAGGMGMGLYIVHSIVSDLSGWIEVENNSYGGASFLIRFPACCAS